MRALTTLAFAALLLTACGPKTPAPAPGEAKSDVVVLDPGATPTTPHEQAPMLTGFTHEAGVDRFGYFLPRGEVKVGNWKLENLSMGTEDEFVKWEKGDRTNTYAPALFEFVDVTSPKQTNELGQEVYSGRIRVLPSAYKVGPGGDLHFAGRDDKVGDVQFDGTIDMAGLAAQQKAGPGGKPATAPVITGELKVGPMPFKAQGFDWFGGD